MNKLHVFVDNSNLWIEGQRYAVDPTGETEHKDATYRVDFGKVLEWVSKGRQVVYAGLYGSEPPPNDTVWAQAREKGFKVQVFKRNFRNREKKVDTQICVDITRAAYTHFPKERVLILVAGDSDYLPAVEEALAREWTAEAYFWSKASKEIKTHKKIAFNDISPLVMKLGYLDIGTKRSPRILSSRARKALMA